MAGLRQQWRRDAMRVIQDKALDLFDERGFAAVTIEEIATAAEVSASSIYRYFGTKERLLAADEFETMSAERLAEILDPADPVGSLVAAVERYESPGDGAADAGAAARRIRYFFTEPSVRAAALATLDRAAEQIAPTFEEHGMTAAQARVAANALTFGYFAALETWHTDGGVRPIAHYVEEGLRPLRAIWTGTTG